MQILKKWEPSIINHLYWSIQTCRMNGQELVERFTSCIYHVVNRHTFIGNQFYKKCEHEKYTEDREWMTEGSAPHEALKKIVLNKSLLKDMELLNLNVFTTHLEVFHALKIRYLPKSIFYEQEKMEAGMMIAALDHNLNIQRGYAQSKTKEGQYKPKYEIGYHRFADRFVAKRIKRKKDYSFMREIAVNAYNKAVKNEKATKPTRKRLFRAPSERPDRSEIIERTAKFSRFDN